MANTPHAQPAAPTPAAPQTQAPAPAPPAAKPPQLKLERTFDATAERLWSFWTDPAKYARWLSPQKADLVIHEWDLRVGGKVRFDMPLDNGQVNKEEGVFHVLDKPKRLVTGNADKTFLIDVTFTPLDDGKRTKLTVLVDGVPNEWHAAATQGWGVGLDKLAKLLPSPSTMVSAPARHHVTPDRYLVVERHFNAPPSKVYGAWTTPALLEKFFWPLGQGKVKEFDFKVGGRLVIAHAKEPWTATWGFKEIVPNQKLVIEDHWDDGSGHVAVGTLEFLAHDGGTLMRVRHGPFPKTGPYQPEMAGPGFGMVADRLAELTETCRDGDGFRVVRHLRAPVEKVWAMWTAKENLAKWWGVSAKQMGYAFQVNQLDVRVGGTYDIQMSNAQHGELHNHGTYLEVIPNQRIVQCWDFDIFLGPGEKPYPILIEIDFQQLPKEAGGGTVMTFTQGPMSKGAFTEGSRQGVISNLGHMANTLGE